MSERTRWWMSALAIVAVILAPTSGCLQPIGEAVQDAVPGEAHNASPGTETAEGEAGSQGEELSEGASAEPYEVAMKSVQPDGDGVQRVGIEMDVDPLGEGTPTTADLLIDRDKRLVVATVENRSSSATGKGGGDTLLMGAVHKTGFLGTPELVTGFYNESKTWNDTFEELGVGGDGVSTTSRSDVPNEDPMQFFDGLNDVPSDAEVERSRTSYGGQTVTQLDVAWTNETASVNATMLIDDEQRPLKLDAELRGENVSSYGDSRVEMVFTYGSKASHPLEEAVYRAETMTLLKGDEFRTLTSPEGTPNWTVQPSQNAGLVDLDDVEVHVVGSEMTGTLSDDEIVMTMPAEDRKLVTDNATLVYDDADGNGKVSPGDVIRYTPHTDEAKRWTVTLYDEKTGMRTAPGPGALLFAFVTGGLAVLLRRSRAR